MFLYKTVIPAVPPSFFVAPELGASKLSIEVRVHTSALLTMGESVRAYSNFLNVFRSAAQEGFSYYTLASAHTVPDSLCREQRISDQRQRLLDIKEISRCRI